MNNENDIAPINEESNVVEYNIEDIKKRIYTIRGKQVMLDSDVAEEYHYKTKALNLAVKRNIERFPEDFCFQITESEWEILRFQFETSKNDNKDLKDNRGGRRYLPYVFTEQGIAMLAGVLKSEIAVKMSISIIKAFIEMRKFIAINGQVFERLSTLEYKQIENERNFDKLFNLLHKEENINQKIFFEGQIYNAYSLIIDIIKKANIKITIIDNYIDDSILKMLTKKNKDVEVVILTSSKSNIQKLNMLMKMILNFGMQENYKKF